MHGRIYEDLENNQKYELEEEKKQGQIGRDH